MSEPVLNVAERIEGIAHPYRSRRSAKVGSAYGGIILRINMSSQRVKMGKNFAKFQSKAHIPKTQKPKK